MSDFINPEDRMPTIDEFRSFDPAAAWDRLSPEQQRAVGILAVELSVATGLPNYENTYTKDECAEIADRGDDASTLFYDGTEPLWHLMFGWSTSAKLSDDAIVEMTSREAALGPDAESEGGAT